MKRFDWLPAAALFAGLFTASPAVSSPPLAPASVAPSAASVPAAERRPNVLVWLLDDVGFAQLSSFGGLVATPNIDRVARQGLRYTNYHTTPICSASRASLLSGRNSHSVHLGWHALVSRALPGYDARIPASAGSIAANLHAGGYATYALGKWDHVPSEEASPAGPFRQWPLGQGFDKFYGFLAGDTDNWNPTLLRDSTPIAKPADPDYHLDDDLADQAIAMVRSREALAEKRPFFMYWATGTAHAPHHAPKAWIERYQGRFDMGWDAARERTLKAQKAQGVVSRAAKLAPRPDGMPAWSSLSPDQKKLYARQMEVFAASLSHADAQFGRILDALEAGGELENTIVIITSDNGASAEGAPNGMYNEAFILAGGQPSVTDNMAFHDEWGGPSTYPHYSLGWAVAGNTPYRYYKQTTHEGGTRVPLVVSWPKGIPARGELRGQFVHVSDIAPTILDLAKVPLAKTVNDVEQSPMEGVSFAYSLSDPANTGGKRAQYFEMYGNKGLWADGWSLVTSHRVKVWDAREKPADEPWELYDLTNDPGQLHDLASARPEKVRELSRLFEEQARRYSVLPVADVSDGLAEGTRKVREEHARRGGLWRYAGPLGNIPPTLAPPIASRDFVMKATLRLADAPTTGPVFAYGGRLGGMALYLRNGKPVFVVNALNGRSTEVAADRALPAGANDLVLKFAGVPGTAHKQVTITANGQPLAQGVIDGPIPVSFGISETFGVGIDNGSAVLPEAGTATRLAREFGGVEFDFGS